MFHLNKRVISVIIKTDVSGDHYQENQVLIKIENKKKKKNTSERKP